MVHVNRDNKKLLTRVRRVAGQVTALERARESGVECNDLLVQIAAVRGAVHALMLEVLDERLQDQVVGEVDAGKRAAEAGSLMQLLRGYAR